MHELQTATDPTRRRGPLDGIKVLDVSTVYAAPITAMLLGDMGADVLKAGTNYDRPPGRLPRALAVVEGDRRRARSLNLAARRQSAARARADADGSSRTSGRAPEKWGLGPDTLLDATALVSCGHQVRPGRASRAARVRHLMEAMSGFAHQTGRGRGALALRFPGLTDGWPASRAPTPCDRGTTRPRGGPAAVVRPVIDLAPLGAPWASGPARPSTGSGSSRAVRTSAEQRARAPTSPRGRWVAISAGATSIAGRVMAGRPR